MSTIKVLNMAGAEVGTVELNDSIFGIEPNTAVVHEVVKNHLANCRQGTQSALTKGEVSYTTAKPWRQKGTGRARAGYKGSPVWTHGGVAFAPKPRDYSYTLNKKVKRLALKSALSAMAASDAIVVIDDIKVDEIKTKTFKAFLDAVNVSGKKNRCIHQLSKSHVDNIILLKVYFCRTSRAFNDDHIILFFQFMISF